MHWLLMLQMLESMDIEEQAWEQVLEATHLKEATS
jgi:hypothetical protein